uniref:Uncharacterized protein n=1 Tax=Ulva partita TaxID=1605170 RepID=A0A1C9ZPS7_9CHLO|nr:hypothetical protein [Ulva partita]
MVNTRLLSGMPDCSRYDRAPRYPQLPALDLQKAHRMVARLVDVALHSSLCSTLCPVRGPAGNLFTLHMLPAPRASAISAHSPGSTTSHTCRPHASLVTGLAFL